ncbi:MAG: hypothetical protein IKG67_15120 [Parasporobacterium sp.]|nr:hypothetical protein [Parasporobacterium sp.]
MKKYLAVFLFIVLLASVPFTVFASPADTDDNAGEQKSEYTEMVNEAIRVLADRWNDEYWTEDYPEREYILDIRSTRIICIRENLTEEQDEILNGAKYIIDFLLYDDYLNYGDIPSGQGIGYYTQSGVNNNVVVLADGSMVCMSKVLDMYRARFFEIDFRPIIEQVIDLHEQFNQVVHFKNHEVVFE